VHLPDVVAEPPVIGVVGRGKSFEYRLDVLGLPVNDRDISAGVDWMYIASREIPSRLREAW
jgi:hypothetical protein